MYNKIIPTNDDARLQFLQATVSAHANDSMAGKSRLRIETATAVESLLYQFQEAHSTVKRHTEQSKRARRLVRERIELLRGSLGTVWKLARQRVNIGKLPSELLEHYGLPPQGPMPRPSQRAGWLSLAADALEGHHAALGAGLPTLDMSEVEQELPDAQQAVSELNLILDVLKDAQVRRRALRKEVTDLARAISMELRRSLLSQPAAHRRAIMRSYGFHFQPEKGKEGEVKSLPAPETEVSNPAE